MGFYWFIFPCIGRYRIHNGTIGTNRHYSRDNNWRFWSNLEFLKPPSSKTDGFFRWEKDYHDHSRQLVEGIPKWLDRMNFTECEYKYGRVVFQEQIEATNIEPNNVPYVEELRSHLEVGYPEIMNRYRIIQSKDEQSSLKIKEIMSAQYKNSFQKIIIDRMSSFCPKLRKRNENVPLVEQYNVYDDVSIYHIIFTELFNSWSVGSLDIKDSTELWYHNSETKMIAKGSKEDIEKLMELKSELFRGRDIKNIINEYRILRDNLVHDIEKEKLRTDLNRLHSDINGGMSLKGYVACNLCPRRPS